MYCDLIFPSVWFIHHKYSSTYIYIYNKLALYVSVCCILCLSEYIIYGIIKCLCALCDVTSLIKT